MNRILTTLLAASMALGASAQTVDDQNPQFAVSREKYMKMADSLSRWHGTTLQNTYKAYDWYEARQERRDARRNNRLAVRLARAERGRYYDPYYYSNPWVNDPYYYNNRWNGRRNNWSRWWW